MTRATVTIRIRVAWWLRAYLGSVALFSTLTDMVPDWDKVARMVERGVKVVTR